MLVRPTVLEVRRLEPAVHERHFREKYRHPLRKALYFALREGPSATLRKWRSKVAERRIEAEIGVVVARVEVDGRERVGFTRDLGGALAFHPELVFAAAGQKLDEIVVPEDVRAALEAYLPVPSCPVPAGLVERIVRANPGMGSGAREFAREGEPRGGHAGKEERGAAGEVVEGEAGSGSGAGRVRGGIGGIGRRGGGGRAFVLGCGAYVREQVLRHLRRDVAMALDYRAALIRRHCAPAFPVTDRLDEVLEALSRVAEPLVVIATYHADHATMALRVLEANPGARVFVEKPPAVTLAEAEALIEKRRAGSWIDVGFNRRYAPFTVALRGRIRSLPRPLVITARVKELKLPPTHWYFWPNQGTRITGNVCHWIDLAYHLVGVPPREVVLANSGDTVALSVLFGDGSLAAITATDAGDDLAGVTEEIEIRAGATAVVIRDFRTAEVRSDGRSRRLRRVARDKGHAAMYRDVRRRWAAGAPPAYGIDDLRWVTYLTEAASELLRTGGRTHVVGSGG